MFKKSRNNSTLLLSNSDQGSTNSIHKVGLINFSFDIEDGSVRCGSCKVLVGNKNCNIVAILFGAIFILVGTLLLFISSKESNNNANETSESHVEANIIGILLVIIGILLSVTGCIIKLIYWNFNPKRSDDLRNALKNATNALVNHNETFCSIKEEETIISNTQGENEVHRKNSNVSNNSSTGSIFLISPNILHQRRATLPIVNFYHGRRTLESWKEKDEPSTSDAETQVSVTRLNMPNPLDSSSASLNPSPYRKTSLTFRPSLPEVITSYFSHHYSGIGKLNKSILSRSRSIVIPMNELQKSKSDIPFGSIASLKGNGDIACFPKKSLAVRNINIPEINVVTENGNSSSVHNFEFNDFKQTTMENDLEEIILNINTPTFCEDKHDHLTEITVT